MEIVILDDAYKHGITRESILSCLYNLRGNEVLEDPPLKSFWAGFDYAGNALEIITIEEEERLVIIHAMKLRPQYYYLLEGN